jgi:hypothetical protein
VRVQAPALCCAQGVGPHCGLMHLACCLHRVLLPGRHGRSGLRCGAPTSYCPLGSGAPSATPNGSYAIATPQGLFYNRTLCEPGRFCVAGVAAPCPAGRYGDAPGGESPACVGSCTAGYFCPSGSVQPDPQPCGSAALYCPAVRGTLVTVPPRAS